MREAITILAKLLQEKEELIKEKDEAINTLLKRNTNLENELRKNFVNIKALKCCSTINEVYNLIKSVEVEE